MATFMHQPRRICHAQHVRRSLALDERAQAKHLVGSRNTGHSDIGRRKKGWRPGSLQRSAWLSMRSRWSMAEELQAFKRAVSGAANGRRREGSADLRQGVGAGRKITRTTRMLQIGSDLLQALPRRYKMRLAASCQQLPPMVSESPAGQLGVCSTGSGASRAHRPNPCAGAAAPARPARPQPASSNPRTALRQADPPPLPEVVADGNTRLEPPGKTPGRP